jgi:hypothetical protein
VLHLAVSMTHEICVQFLRLLFNPNSNFLISEVQFKYICATVHFTCPVENVINAGPRIGTAIWNFIAAVDMLEKGC